MKNWSQALTRVIKENDKLKIINAELLEACKYALEMCNGFHNDVDTFKAGIKGCMEQTIAKAEREERE